MFATSSTPKPAPTYLLIAALALPAAAAHALAEMDGLAPAVDEALEPLDDDLCPHPDSPSASSLRDSSSALVVVRCLPNHVDADAPAPSRALSPCRASSH